MTTELTTIAAAAIESGAEALTLTNTLVGMAIDVERRRPLLSNGTGGVSGAALHPVALRCVYQCRAAFPETPIVGVGGVAKAEDAIEFFMAGANAVQVGTATFANPRACANLVRDLEKWCRSAGVSSIREIVGAAQVASTAPLRPAAPKKPKSKSTRQGKTQ